MNNHHKKIAYQATGGACAFGVFLIFAFAGPYVTKVTYNADGHDSTKVQKLINLVVPEEKDLGDQAIYIKTPDAVKAIYMTQCVVGTPSFRANLVELIENTELNAVIIDVKDYTGWLGFPPESEDLQPYFGTHCYAPDMKEFIRMLNEKGVYVIARITVFQDPLWAKAHTDLAVQRETTRGIWSDNKGLHFIDVGSKPFWDYIVTISEEAHAMGFDELNYDYVRYPSDGPMQDIYFPSSQKVLDADPENGKVKQLEEFFAYLDKETEHLGIPISADLFGMTTTNANDLNIGQVLENALPHFDFIAPMVYPSHYPANFNGWKNPNTVPHELIEFVMTSGVERVEALKNATTTPQAVRDHVSSDQLRPWIQDFDYGGNYGATEVRAQIQATYDSGLDSWMIWDPANRYTRGALLPE